MKGPNPTLTWGHRLLRIQDYCTRKEMRNSVFHKSGCKYILMVTKLDKSMRMNDSVYTWACSSRRSSLHF